MVNSDELLMANQNDNLCPVEIDIKEDELLEHQRRIRCILQYAILTIFGLLLITLIILFIVLPVVFAHSVDLQRLLMFTNIGLTSDKHDFEKIPRHPKTLFHNFYIQFEDEFNETITLGVWHLFPLALYPNATNQSSEVDSERLLNLDAVDVIVYFHGSGETRRDSNMMYQVLIKFFHVIAFDYRDYGDSTPAKLSESAVASDAVNVFKWVKQRTSRKIYIWGHSLGTPLGTLTNLYLPKELKPHGLILEAPLTSMHEEIPLHPYGKLFAWLPWFKQTVQDPLDYNGFLFNTSDYILDIDCPIMILHAEDDSIIPYTLGKKLAHIAATERKIDQGNVTYVQFSAKFRYDHFRIFQSRRLLTLIPNFTLICDDFHNKSRTTFVLDHHPEQ